MASTSRIRRWPRSFSCSSASAVASRSVAEPAASATGLAWKVPLSSTASGRVGIEHFHDVGTPGDGADRIAAADDLAEQGQIRGDAEQRLRAAIGQPHRDHLVEDEEDAVPLRQAAQKIQEIAGGRDDPARTHHGLDDNGREIGGVPLDDALHGGRIVERQDDDAVAHGRRNAVGGHADRRMLPVRPLQDPARRSPWRIR